MELKRTIRRGESKIVYFNMDKKAKQAGKCILFGYCLT